jgi:malate dehydrogenase
LETGRVTTLAALDSTRLQTALSQHFSVRQDRVTGCRTYGGHGEQMAVFKGGIRIAGIPLTDVLAGKAANGIGMTEDQWKQIQQDVRGGGARIIQLRGRSSYQSPSQQSVDMLRGALGRPYEWPCGAYLNRGAFSQIMMAMPVALSGRGVEWSMPEGAQEDQEALKASYEHLVALRDQTIADGILPPLADWGKHNPNLV